MGVEVWISGGTKLGQQLVGYCGSTLHTPLQYNPHLSILWLDRSPRSASGRCDWPLETGNQVEGRPMTRHDASRLNCICKRRASYQDYEEEHEMSSSGQLRLEAKSISMDWYPRTYGWLINVAFAADHGPILFWGVNLPSQFKAIPQLVFHYLSTEPSPGSLL